MEKVWGEGVIETGNQITVEEGSGVTVLVRKASEEESRCAQAVSVNPIKRKRRSFLKTMIVARKCCKIMLFTF